MRVPGQYSGIANADALQKGKPMPETDVGHLFHQFAIMLGVTLAVGLAAVRLRQPLIVAFIAVGILLGPSALGMVEPTDTLELLAEFGIALLLFVVGLRLDLNLIRTIGPVSLATGLGQITFTSLFVFLIARMLGMDMVPALYVAAAMSFSSTIIIVKLLSDKREIDSLHGRIAVGFLIVQDIMVVITMIVITALGAAGDDATLAGEVGMVLLKGIGLLALTAVLIRWVLPWVLHLVARSTELLVLFAIGIAIGMAAFSDVIGFSKEVGAFLGGVALATTHYREAIGSRLVSVRDFLLLFFFISLGAQLDMAVLGMQVETAILLSLFVLIGNPLIVLTIMGIMGFRRRTAFLSGLAVAQISEFSLILASLGLAIGHIGNETVGLITLVALITIGISTYLILYSHQIYERIAPLIRIFERRQPFQEQRLDTRNGESRADAIVFGLGRYGSGIARELHQAGWSVIGIDFDPVVVAEQSGQGFPVLYGDAEDVEFLLSLPLDQARCVISSVPEERVSITLCKGLRAENFSGHVAATTHHEILVPLLKEAGCDRVLLPFHDAAEQAASDLIGDQPVTAGPA